MAQCWYCGKKLTQDEIDQSIKYLEQGLLCGKHLSEKMGWLDYGEYRE